MAPAQLGPLPEAADAVFVDEAQDVNEAQFDLLRKAGRAGRLVMVGDRHQAIYGFRGAGVGMLDRIEQALAGTERGVLTVPLSVCYRCPLVVLELIRRRGHVTHLEARPGAPRGVLQVRDPEGAWWAGIDPAALALCRTNAPLAKAYLQLLSGGIRATIRGRGDGGIYGELVALIERHAPPSGSLAGLIRSVSDYEAQEAPKLIEAERDDALERLRDLVEVVSLLADGVADVRALLDRLERIFVADDDDNPGVTLSTIHKAKGLQAPEVWILSPELLPWPYARGWEEEQEANLEYVAYSRSQGTLVFVGDPPDEVYDWPSTGLVTGSLVEGDAGSELLTNVAPAVSLEPAKAPEPEREPVDLTGLDLSGLPSWPRKGDGTYDPPRSLADWQPLIDAYEGAGVPVEVSTPRGWGRKLALVFADVVRVSACLRRVGSGSGTAPVEKGEHAIDVVPIRPGGRPSGSTRRVLRTAAWQGRAAARINEALRDQQRRVGGYKPLIEPTPGQLQLIHDTINQAQERDS